MRPTILLILLTACQASGTVQIGDSGGSTITGGGTTVPTGTEPGTPGGTPTGGTAAGTTTDTGTWALPDDDGDGFDAGLDCDDDDPNTFPGQTAFFTMARGDGSFDYDCNGEDEVELDVVGECNPTGAFACATVVGWAGAVPECGDLGGWSVSCQGCGAGCCEYAWPPTPTTQGCR